MSHATGAKTIAENLPERAGNPGQAAVNPGEQHVEQRDQGEKADQHDGHIHGELAAVDGAAGNGADEVFFLVQFVFGDDDLAFSSGDLGFRHQHLGDEDGAGRGHDDGGEQVARFNALRDVHGHDAAGDVGHAAGHDDHQFAARGFGEKRADSERGLGLAHEDTERPRSCFPRR